MRFFLVAALFMASQFAKADERPPFPQLDTEGYCTALVSKMLNKTEQQTEKDKCLVYETTMKAKLQPFWYLVESTESDRLMRDYLKEVRFQTYGTVGFSVAQALGRACIDGRVFCSPGEATAEIMFSAIKSDYYCYLKLPNGKADEIGNCLEEERKRKERLARYWNTVPQDKRDYCNQFAFSQKFSPFEVLSICVAPEIGNQCLAQKRQCRPS